MFRQYRHVAVEHSMKVFVTVSDLVSVQRVVMMLNGRNHQITRLEAEEAGQGQWRLCIGCTADDDEADLMRVRLERLPSVLTVRLDGGIRLAAQS